MRTNLAVLGTDGKIGGPGGSPLASYLVTSSSPAIDVTLAPYSATATSDSTAAVNAAIAMAALSGQRVLVPDGKTVRCDGQLNLNPTGGILAPGVWALLQVDGTLTFAGSALTSTAFIVAAGFEMPFPTNLLGGVSAGTGPFSGQATPVYLTADAPALADVVKVTAGRETLFNHGDWVRVGAIQKWDPNEATPNTSVDEYIGELVQVTVPAGYTLASSLSSGAGAGTQFNLSAPADARVGWFPEWSQFNIAVGTEQITVTTVQTLSAAAVTLQVVARGAAGTTAATHSPGAAVTLAGGQVALKARLGGPAYTVAAVAFISKIAMGTAQVTGHGAIVGPAETPSSTATATGVLFDRVASPTVDGKLRFLQWDDCSINFKDSPNADASGLDVRGYASRSSTFYGVFFSYASSGTVTDSRFTEVRHAVTCGGGTSRSGISRNVIVGNCSAYSTTASGFDTHAGNASITFIGCHSYDAFGSGFNLRSPNARIVGCLAVRARQYGCYIHNQSGQDTNVAVAGFDAEDCNASAIRYSNDLGDAGTLLSGPDGSSGTVILAGTAAPFNIVQSSNGGFTTANGQLLIGQDQSTEQMSYDTTSGTAGAETFHITARALGGTTAISHAAGEQVLQGATGTGANISSVNIANVNAVRCAGPSVRIISTDTFPLRNVQVSHVTAVGQTSGTQAVQLENVADSQVSDIVVDALNPAVTTKGVQLVNCSNVSVTRPRVTFTGGPVSGTIAVSVEGTSSGCKVSEPKCSTADTGVSFANAVAGSLVKYSAQDLSGCTTAISLGSGSGNVSDAGAGIASFADYFATSEVYTVPWFLQASTIGTLTLGNVVGVQAVCRQAGTYGHIRFNVATAPTGLTDARLGVWSAGRTLLEDTGNQQASINGATGVLPFALSAPVTLAIGDVVYLGFGYVGGSSAGTIKGIASTTAVTNLVPGNYACVASAWTGGALPNLPTTGSGQLPWIELTA